MSSSFHARTTAMEVAASANLAGKLAVITGPTSGIGVETARALAAAGTDLILGCRDLDAGRRLADRISSESGRSVIAQRMDLCDFASVTAFCHGLGADTRPIDLLICNAGASKTLDTHQKNGIDIRFAGNHLGHFLLAHLLKPRMAKQGARIVLVSSAASKGRPVNLDDLEWTKRPHDMFAAYGESKTANILFAIEASRHWAPDGITAHAVLPGSMLTGLQRHHGDELMKTIGFLDADGHPNPVMKTIEQGASTTVWGAVAPELDGHGGLVLEDCAIARPYEEGMHPWSGFDAAVIDADVARALWDRSIAILARCGVAVQSAP